MTRKGKRKYRCGDCGNEQYIHWIELNRASRPRCTGCGSHNLDLITKEAKEERVIGNTNLRNHSDTQGDVIRAKQKRQK